MNIKKFIIDNTLPNYVKLTMPNCYESKIIMPGVQTLELKYSADYGENPDSILAEFLSMYPFIKEVESSTSYVAEVSDSRTDVTREALWKMDEVGVENLAREHSIEFGRVKNLDSKKWKLIKDLCIPE